MMKLFREEEGQTLVFIALCTTALLGFLALAVDVGMLFRARRNLQIAADGAATAAALDYYYNSMNTGAVAAANGVGAAAATLNGVTAGNGTTVDVHCPVVNGAYKSSTCNGYFEAVLSQPNPTFVMGMITGIGSTNVAARAVAGTPYVSSYCIYVLNPNGNLKAGGGNGPGTGGTSSMWLQGSFTVKANKCGIVDNGTASNALDLNGNGGTLSAGSIAVVGGCSGCNPPAYTSGVAPVTNPLKKLCVPYTGNPNDSSCPMPTCSSGGPAAGTASNPTVVGNGGSVCYTGDSNGNLTLSNVKLNGTFIFNGKGTLTFGGNVTSDATNGSTIDLAYPQTDYSKVVMTENSGTVFNLSAPTASTSPYQGVVLMAPTNNYGAAEFDFGHSNGDLTGTVNGIFYLPSGTLFLHDSGGDHSGGLTLNTDLIVGQIDDVTASLTINSYSTSNPTATPLLAVALVE
ncbi:pilus assembly protein TadG-related protein [Occallatibacter savannae]|uniref:pilus assembly protein TadG-related protein n=1 Tax=Occallatibacter savannae TaxID=1002691 RepID=UPI000D68ECAE|nr:Tad domain-containing protein [Occallatibacter savannae]